MPSPTIQRPLNPAFDVSPSLVLVSKSIPMHTDSQLERFPASVNLFLPMGSLTAANQIRSSLPATARARMAKGYSTDLELAWLPWSRPVRAAVMHDGALASIDDGDCLHGIEPARGAKSRSRKYVFDFS